MGFIPWDITRTSRDKGQSLGGTGQSRGILYNIKILLGGTLLVAYTRATVINSVQQVNNELQNKQTKDSLIQLSSSTTNSSWCFCQKYLLELPAEKARATSSYTII